MYTGTSGSGRGSAEATGSGRVDALRAPTTCGAAGPEGHDASATAAGEGATRDTVFDTSAGAAVGKVTSARRRVIGARSYVSAVSQLVPAMPRTRARALS